MFCIASHSSTVRFWNVFQDVEYCVCILDDLTPNEDIRCRCGCELYHDVVFPPCLLYFGIWFDCVFKVYEYCSNCWKVAEVVEGSWFLIAVPFREGQGIFKLLKYAGMFFPMQSH